MSDSSIVDGWGDGWGDEDDGLDLSLNDGNSNNDNKGEGIDSGFNGANGEGTGNENVDDGDEWDFDDDEVLENLNNENVADDDHGSDERLSKNMNSGENKMLKYLKDYISNLQGNAKDIIDGVNRRFHEECNTNEAALELCRYYHSRPNLTEYTLNTELSRMDYQIVLSDEVVLVDKTDIHQWIADRKVSSANNHFNNGENIDVDDMLLRSSNQSLLADALPILTTSSLRHPHAMAVVRSDYLATAVATQCRFVLDMRPGHARSVQVDCTLSVSIPSGNKTTPQQNQQNQKSSSQNDGRLHIASLRLKIYFSPEPSHPNLSYELLSITIHPHRAKSRHNDSELEMAASALERDLTELDMMPNDNHNTSNPVNHPAFKQHDQMMDNFLTSLASTQSGFQSALKEIDTVTNVSKKLNFLKSGASSLLVLPSAEDILLAEEPEQFRQDDQNNVGAFPRPPPESGHVGAFPRPPPPPPPLPQSKNVPHHFGAFPRPPPEPSTVGAFPRPPPDPSTVGAFPRPTSAPVTHNNAKPPPPPPLIGGLLISGLNRLAKVASKPDESSPSATFPPPNSGMRSTIAPAVHPPPPPPPLPNSIPNTGLSSSSRPLPPPPPPPPPASGGASNNNSPLRLYRREDTELEKPRPPPTFTSKSKLNSNDDCGGDDDDHGADGWSDDGLDDLDLPDRHENIASTASGDHMDKEKRSTIHAPSTPRPPNPPSFHPNDGSVGNVQRATVPGTTTPANAVALTMEENELQMMAKRIYELKMERDKNSLGESIIIGEDGTIPTRKRFVSRSERLGLAVTF